MYPGTGLPPLELVEEEEEDLLEQVPPEARVFTDFLKFMDFKSRNIGPTIMIWPPLVETKPQEDKELIQSTEKEIKEFIENEAVEEFLKKLLFKKK